ncbi:BglG family transcription antiterminator [Okibacterium fritillariae]|uniref:Transcriptional antiterminator, BglG family n=1 Tax=Okibacterium fritillariae TaxID=123320 RepID=A0A1T5K7I4_9MICO|nr:PRD domain-containing protein [Okibacterium fritillariae]SKC59485.1 transcriptional antiterminator, BglG family [Okibacterium fritillariae]
MIRDKHERLLTYLARDGGWVTAGELSDVLGVTPRSVRSYVTQIKDEAAPLAPIRSGGEGYRIDREAYTQFVHTGAGDAETPRDRLYAIVRRLIDSPDGLDVYELAATLHVSDSTIEADLGRVRQLLSGETLRLGRAGSIVTLTGTETARRRLLSRMFREETERGMVELVAIQREFSAQTLGAFKTDLVQALTARGYYVNEYGIADVLLHIAIAVDRVSKHRDIETNAPQADLPPEGVGQDLHSLIQTHFEVDLGGAEIDYLAHLLGTRVITPGAEPAHAHAHEGDDYLDRYILETMRDITQAASEQYVVDLSDEDFLVRLSMHVQNLVRRAKDRSYSRNPLTKSIKSSFPMIYELAVYIASRLQERAAITVNDDEIAYIAMHVGAQLERQMYGDDLVTCTIVCPNYYDLHSLLLQRVEGSLGTELRVRQVVTRSDVDWSTIDTDLVLSTIEPPVPSPGVVVIQPFLTAGDIDRARREIAEIKRMRRRERIKGQLLKYFRVDLFFRNLTVADSDTMIRTLGERMVEASVVDQGYVEGALQRERMSSTAFTEALAVPHAMTMTATRTAIAISVNETPLSWGEYRVNVVAFIAFSAVDRGSFQSVFDQFVEVFSNRADVQRIVRNAVDFPSFIDELVHVIDA